eukprot:9486779-Pyramimonas_sp.AAC.1
MPITYIAGAGARGGLLAPDDQPMPITYNTLTSFYESSCANNGKRALKTLSYIAGAGARGGLLVPAYQCGRLRRLRQRQAPAAGAPDQVHSCGEDAQAAHHLCRYAAEEEGLLPEGARAPGVWILRARMWILRAMMWIEEGLLPEGARAPGGY